MNYEKFEPLLGYWGEFLRPFIESEECDKIYAKLKEESRKGKIICPDSADTFRAFKATPYKDVKVVFLLQDPYPTVKNGVIVADGIALSCSKTNVLQPSLIKFYEAIERDDPNKEQVKGNRKPDLSYLCGQGVLMLNTALTVEKDKVGSHGDLWRPFTKFLLEEVFGKKKEEVIFVLCGAESHYFERFINPMQHRIYKIEHPSNAARKLRDWENDDIFNRINKILKAQGKQPIIWYDDLPFRMV